MSTESFVIWGAAFLMCALVMGVYSLGVRRGIRRDTMELEEAVALGINQPQAQHPQISLERCIGCGACVDACPEGGVLGLIDGKARIINGLRCIGHGICADACPVEAVHMGLAEGDHLPWVNDDLQTSVPGVFIAGELGGLALIRNAVTQGERATRAALRGLPNEKGALVIIGAGPAGMAAALAAHVAGHHPLLLDQDREGGTILQYPRKKLVLTQPMDLPGYGRLTRSEYSKEELLAIFNETLARQGVQVQHETHVKAIACKGEGLELTTSKGMIHARRVILALGRRGSPRKLGVPGEELKKVAYQLLDAGLYSGEDILVVGGGDSAVEAAMALAVNGKNRVILAYRKPKFFRIKKRNAAYLEAAMKRSDLEVMFETNLVEIDQQSVALQTAQGLVRRNNHRVFIFAGGVPPYGLLREMGIAFGKPEVAA